MDRGHVSIREIGTTYRCGVCGTVACPDLVRLVDQITSNPRWAQHNDPSTIPRSGMELIERRAHGMDRPDDEDGPIVSVEAIRTTYRCGVCGTRGCEALGRVLQRVLDDPDMTQTVLQMGVPREALALMEREGHGVEGDDDGPGQGGGRRKL